MSELHARDCNGDDESCGVHGAGHGRDCFFVVLQLKACTFCGTFCDSVCVSVCPFESLFVSRRWITREKHTMGEIRRYIRSAQS